MHQPPPTIPNRALAATGKVLFLCTGNYYRSRFAELLFNALASRQALPWCADSRALDIELGRQRNIGPLSSHVGPALRRLSISSPHSPRPPMQVTEEDLRAAHLVIAMKEAEHRPRLMRLFPHWAQRVQYWHIHDVEDLAPEQALSAVADHVRELLQQLSPQAGSPPPAPDR